MDNQEINTLICSVKKIYSDKQYEQGLNQLESYFSKMENLNQVTEQYLTMVILNLFGLMKIGDVESACEQIQEVENAFSELNEQNENLSEALKINLNDLFKVAYYDDSDKKIFYLDEEQLSPLMSYFLESELITSLDYQIRGWVQMYQNDYDQSIELFQESLKMDKKQPELSIVLSEIFMNQKQQLEKSEQVLLDAIQCDEKNSNLHYKLGILYDYKMNEHDKALEMLQKSFDLDQKNVESLNLVGFNLRKFQNKNKQAEQTFLKCLEIDPNYMQAINNLAFYYRNIEQNNEKAEEYYLRAIEIDPNVFEVQSNIAMFYEKSLKDIKKAEQQHISIIERFPDNKNAYLQYSIFLFNQDKKEQAYEQAQTVLEMDPEDEQALQIVDNTIEIYEERQKWRQVESLIKSKLEQDPENLQYYDALIDIYRDMLDEQEKAVEIYEKVIANFPPQRLYLNDFASLLIKKFQDYDLAEKLFLQCLELDPNDYAAYNNLYHLYYTYKKDLLGAEKYILKLEEIEPENKDVLHLLSNYYFSINNQEMFMKYLAKYQEKCEGPFRWKILNEYWNNKFSSNNEDGEDGEDEE